MSHGRNEKLLAAALILSVVTLVLDQLIWRHTLLLSIPAIAPYLTLTAIVSGALWIRFRFHRLAKEERRDQQAGLSHPSDSALFDADADYVDSLSRIHAHRQYERWFMPLLAPALALLAGYWGYRLFEATRWPLDVATERLFAASFLVGQGFALFLLGRYLLGLSRAPADRLVRGPATYILSAAAISALTGVASIMSEWVWPAADLWIRRVFSLYLIAVAIELLLNTVVYLYRPKKQRTWVTTYESRLTALLTDPNTWSANVAQTLDYQFGIQVSQSGLHRFFSRILLPLIIAQVLGLYALTGLVVIGPEEEAIIERFGHPHSPGGQPRLLTSGLHFKAPWPVDTVRRYPSRRIHTTYIGFEAHADHPHPPLILWTRPHYAHEEQFIAASKDTSVSAPTDDAAVPVNFITINMPVEYRITNLYQYIYRHRDPASLLRMTAHRTVTRALAARDLIDILGEDRQEIGRVVHEDLQAQANALGLGIEILFTGLHGAHPPIPVAAAFESVIGSFEERETAMLQARAFESRTLPLAQAEASERTWIAHGERAHRVEHARGDAALFQTRLALHREMPSWYTTRLYLEYLQRALYPIRKYVIVASPDQEVLIFNLEEKMRPDLFDFGPGMREDRFL